jgi:hypothetical protein
LWIWAAERPRSLADIGKYTFVASTYEERSYPESTSPSSVSAAPRPYTLAVSMKLIPSSNAAFTQACACSRSTPPE